MKPIIKEDATLSSYADSPAILAQVARAKEILAKHPLPTQILPTEAAKQKAAELCETLKQYRQRNNLTQTELADKVGMQKEFISRIENGKVDVQLSTFLKIIEGLGLKIMVTT
ncbi:MAG: helix-turn-helix transcriptional regulator [Runella zeae]